MDVGDYEDGEFVDDSCDDVDRATGDGRTKASGYQLKNVLKLPRATTYSAQSLYDQIHAGDVNLEPEYQRDVVWPESKQIGLIDSILRNFYVPPVIFVTHQHEDGSETKTCIDGKQRLTSIHRFMDGLIPHRDPLTGSKFWYKISANTQNARGQLLPERYRRLFANKQVVCIEYQDLPDSDEREIFQRVQLGMALTPAEKLQVLNTPMATVVRKLQSEYFKLGSPLDGEGFDWDRSRGGDFRCIAQALYVIAKYPSITSIGTVLQLEKWLHNPIAKVIRGKGKKKATDDDIDEDLSKDDAFLEGVHATFRSFSKLADDASIRALFLRPEWRVSPIEFVMMCLLISVNKDKLTLRELAMKIWEMRVRVRNEHVDIRMNSRVAKTLFDFINQSPDSPQLAEPAKNGLKRKREEEEVSISGRRDKDRKEDEGSSVAAKPHASSIPPPRPDQLVALGEAKKTIAPPRVTPPKPLAAPSASR